MKQNLSTLRPLVCAFIGLGFGLVSFSSSAALSISEPSARIGWGGADNLSQVRTSQSYPTRVQRIDNGYNSNNASSVPVTYQGYSEPSYNTPSSFSNNGYSNSFGNSRNTAYGNTNYLTPLAISTGSRGVLVLDVETNQPLYQKNADVARPIASITKLMTAMVVLDAGLDMSEQIVIQSRDFQYAGGKTSGSDYLKVGDRLNRAQMLLMMLMKSENPAGQALARTYPGGYQAFIHAMNVKAMSLGMSDTNFDDPIGMDSDNVSSPEDLAKMIRAAGQYEVIRQFSTTRSYDFLVENYINGNRVVSARNTSYLVRDSLYPIGISKTGFINEAGKCVVMETRVNNRPAIIVLLGARNSATRWDDAENILNTLAMRRTI